MTSGHQAGHPQTTVSAHAEVDPDPAELPFGPAGAYILARNASPELVSHPAKSSPAQPHSPSAMVHLGNSSEPGGLPNKQNPAGRPPASGAYHWEWAADVVEVRQSERLSAPSRFPLEVKIRFQHFYSANSLRKGHGPNKKNPRDGHLLCVEVRKTTLSYLSRNAGLLSLQMIFSPDLSSAIEKTHFRVDRPRIFDFHFVKIFVLEKYSGQGRVQLAWRSSTPPLRRSVATPRCAQHTIHPQDQHSKKNRSERAGIGAAVPEIWN